MTTKGIWVTPTRYASFADLRGDMRSPIATRARVAGAVNFGQWLPNPDPVLRKMGKSIQVYRDLRADAHVGGCVRRRKAAVKALEYGVDPDTASGRAVDLVERTLDRWDMDRIISEILDAALYGFQPLEAMWEHADGMLVIADLVGKPAEWFGFDDENRLRFRAKDAGAQGELLPEGKFILARQDASYDNPYGIADLSRCFWPTTFKRGGLEFWLRFTEKYGSPFMIGKHPRSTPEAESDLLLSSLEAMVSDAVAVIPDDSSVEIIEAGGKTGSADVYERLLHFCRSEVSIALLGQNQTTEADTTNASAQAGALVTEDIRDADKRLVETAINQAIRWIVERNFDEDAPVFSMWEPEDVDRPRADRDAVLGALPSGPYFTREYWKRAYGFRDEDLGERPPPAPAGGMPMFAENTDTEVAPDQAALDDALDAMAAPELQAQVEKLLRPVIAAVRAGRTKGEALGLLAEAYPDMDETDLVRTLHRLIFAADVWGRLSHQAER